jgi:hypothetical protein
MDAPSKHGFVAPETQSVATPPSRDFDAVEPEAREAVAVSSPGKQGPELVVDNGREAVAVDNPGKSEVATPTLVANNDRAPEAQAPAEPPRRFSAETNAAAEAFVAANNKPTKEAEPQAQAQDEAPKKPGVKETRVMQEAIARMGNAEDLGKAGVDGKWGPKTQAAFEKVCAECGVDPKKVDLTKAPNEETQRLMAHMGNKIAEREAGQLYSHEGRNAPKPVEQSTQVAEVGELSAPKVPNLKAGGGQSAGIG